jgi:S-formylglutathione hydrolase FrmB
VALHEVEGAAASRWERPLQGSLDRLVVRSELLEDNPLGDPAERPLFVYRPATADSEAASGLPAVYLLQGFGGYLEEWLVPSNAQPAPVESLDDLFSNSDVPAALLVFVDASTRWGGSQFLNSSGCGRYLDYLCDEVVPFVDQRYPTLAAARHRGVCGKSSGGYGAIVCSMLRPGIFGALASHAGDALFECCYLPFFAVAARSLRMQFGGSWTTFEDRASAPGFDWRGAAVLFAVYGIACAYSPDPTRPGKPLIPFDAVGRPVEEIWTRWLALDPVRMAARHAPALADMRMIHLDAGSEDDFFLDLGAQALSDTLSALHIKHSFELFAGDHDAADQRLIQTVAELSRALQ